MKKLLYIILIILIITALAGCNYANKVPVLPPNNTDGINTTSYPTTVPYGANDPLNLIAPSDYGAGLATDKYVPGGPGAGINTR